MAIDFTTPWGAAINAVVGIIDRIIPDPAQKAAAQQQVLQLAATEQLAELKAQVDLSVAQAATNTADATKGGYQAGWRPTIGYVCAAALGYYYVLHPVATWYLALSHSTVVPPEMILDDHLWELMLGMLGLGGMRSYEKVKGATK